MDVTRLVWCMGTSVLEVPVASSVSVFLPTVTNVTAAVLLLEHLHVSGPCIGM